MNSLDEDTLIEILQCGADVVIGSTTVNKLEEKLLFLDSHQRSKTINGILGCYRFGMSHRSDNDSFNAEVDNSFDEESQIAKGLKAFWKKNGSKLSLDYEQQKQFGSKLIDFKWVASLPSDSKFGLNSTQPTIKCKFTTTDGDFTMDLLPEGVSQLSRELQKIQEAIEQFK